MEPNPQPQQQQSTQQSPQYHLFKREMKVDDYLEASPENTVCITQSSHPMYGSGSKVWESSVFLAKALAYLNEERVYTLKGKKIVELGCGAGLLSIYLAALGADVLATDLPIVKELVERNLRDNRIVVHDRVKFVPFNWLDKWQIEGKVDYVVASEPFISKEATAGFFKALKFILQQNKPFCKAFIAFKLKDNDLHRFAQMLEDNGLHQSKWSLDDMHPDYADPRTVIYSIQLL